MLGKEEENKNLVWSSEKLLKFFVGRRGDVCTHEAGTVMPGHRLSIKPWVALTNTGFLGFFQDNLGKHHWKKKQDICIQIV